jgi:hypothetical protein
MPLKLSLSGPGSGVEKDRPDYTVYCGDWAVGRDPRGPRERALVLVAECQRTDDPRGSRGDPGGGEGTFQKSWDARKAWAKLEEAP